MKIIAYHVQPYEDAAVEKWSKEHGVEVKVVRDLITPETIELAKGYDGISTQQVIPIKDPIIFEKMKEYGVKQISSRTAGVDMFDLDLAREYGISITNVPRYSPNAIAELALTHAMSLLRNVKHIEKAMAKGDFTWDQKVIAKEIRNCTVGIIGTGFIGLTAAKLFKGLGAKVIGHDLFKNPNAEGILEYTETLDELLAASDVISLHLPLVDATYHLLNKDNIPKIKPGAIVVNTGRGALIDMDALVPYLENGHLAGAGIDVLENETLYVNQKIELDKVKGTYIEKLMNMDNVRFTGHFAFFSETAVDNLVSISLDNIEAQCERGENQNCKN
ncbi:MAG: D-2-hydroxyacid dehydrogenase [Anaerovoracaceae bacterium]